VRQDRFHAWRLPRRFLPLPSTGALRLFLIPISIWLPACSWHRSCYSARSDPSLPASLGSGGIGSILKTMRAGPAPGKACCSGLQPCSAWWVSSQLAHAWLANQTGSELLLSAASFGRIGTVLGFMVGIMTGAVVEAVFIVAMAGVGYAVRAIMVRLAATLRFLLFDGIRPLPENWLENNFIIDAATPAELVPRIWKHHEIYTLRPLRDA